MPSINFDSITSFIGILSLLAGFFLILTGLRVVEVEKITVQSGPRTWVLGIFLFIVGIVFLWSEIQSSGPRVSVSTPTATAIVLASTEPSQPNQQEKSGTSLPISTQTLASTYTPAPTYIPTLTSIPCIATTESEYIISGSPVPDVGIFVDDFLRVFVNTSLVAEESQGDLSDPPVAPIHFVSNTGVTLRVQAQDANACYSLGSLWLQKSDGSCLTLLTDEIWGKNCGSEIPKQIFFDQTYILP